MSESGLSQFTGYTSGLWRSDDRRKRGDSATNPFVDTFITVFPLLTMDRMHEVILYSRKECHLCDVVKDTLTQLRGSADFVWSEVDIDTDPQLRQKFDHEVPVVFIDGRKAFKYRMDRNQFLRSLTGRVSKVHDE